MKSEELQRLTASEPLTLEQEYAMQRSWREDVDKCTFIVLDADKWRAQPASPEESCMAGDVNLFLTDRGDPTLGEIEVMIAEPSCRGRGFGTEAVLMMMSYGGCEQRLPGGDAQAEGPQHLTLSQPCFLAPPGGCEQRLPGGDAQADGEPAAPPVASGADQPRAGAALQGWDLRAPLTAAYGPPPSSRVSGLQESGARQQRPRTGPSGQSAPAPLQPGHLRLGPFRLGV
ncbi:alpha/beta-tubulin-N-acetyltransferase 9 isoform X3 [Talpa occidentalis]|nr:alpha/beta-tubulin-N-acetyltransferase 9 isoform X3 [Talpa occidentalis]XP_054544947.1 alpha/beta-tubulin-N-acetyltransferase 9 isoform X3 [Talpa occidentalis]